jgi:oligo-alginate lyase
MSGLRQVGGNLALDLDVEGIGTVTLVATLGQHSEQVSVDTEGLSSHDFRIPRQGDPLKLRDMTLEAFDPEGALLAMREFEVIEPLDLPQRGMLAMTAADQTTLQNRTSSKGRARNVMTNMINNLDAEMADAVSIPAEKGGDARGYKCPDHGDGLQMVAGDESRHRCPVDGHVYGPDNTDAEHYDYIMGAFNAGRHKALAEEAWYAGVAYQLTEDIQYADRVADILVAYAAVYPSFPVTDRHGDPNGKGAARVLIQSLDEARWMVGIARGMDLIRGSGALTEAETDDVLENLLRPSADLLDSKRENFGIHNIQCWHNAAVLLASLQLSDFDMARETVYGENGIVDQLQEGILGDGIWSEGSFGYHYFALRALLPAIQSMRRAGILLDDSRTRNMLIGPIQFVQPDGTLPLLNDGSLQAFPTNLREIYEQAAALFDDAEVAAPLEVFGRGSTVDSIVYGLKSVKEGGWTDPESTNKPNNGLGSLRATSSNGDTFALVDYGPHGGVHGHPDKLAVSLWMGDDLVLRESGHNGYTEPWYHSWYKRTLAHSTLLRDGLDQTEVEEAATSKSFTRSSGATTLAVETDGIYPGSTMQRVVHTSPNGRFMDVFGATSDESHTWDYVLHCQGTPSTNLSLTSVGNIGFGGPYKYLTNKKAAYVDGDIVVTFTSSDGDLHTVRILGEQGSIFVLAEAPGYPSNSKHAVLLVRRVGANPVFATVVTEGGNLPSGMTVSMDIPGRALTFQEPEENEAVTLSLD